MIIKKIIPAALYTLFGVFLDTFLDIMWFRDVSGSMGISFTSVIVISIAICAVSYNLRIVKIKKLNRGMDSEEYTVFNGAAKEKLTYIIKSKDFKIEAVLGFIISLGYWLVSFIKLSVAYGAANVFANSANIFMLFAAVILIPLYIALLNVFVWYRALNKCFKKKAF